MEPVDPPPEAEAAAAAAAATDDPLEPQEEPSAGRRTGRNLPVAIASGLALATLFLGSLAVGPYAFLSFVVVLVLIALFELDVAFRAERLRPATPIAAGAGIVAFYGAYATGPSAQSLALVLLVIGTLAWALLDPELRGGGPEPVSGAERPKRGPSTAANIGATFLMMLWVPFLASFIGLLLRRPEGPWYLMAVIALSVTNDIGAYAFGSAFGRHKLAPSVSPAKSWEGFAGGIATVLVLAAAVTARLPGFDLPSALGLGAVVAIASTVGDLGESLVKRDLGVKDLGRIIPGHGGIMDRVDAILFALPAGHLALTFFGL
jgi:phosphatidate cytidylyltransferase